MSESRKEQVAIIDLLCRVDRLERNLLRLLDVLALENESVAKIAHLIELQIRGSTER